MQNFSLLKPANQSSIEKFIIIDTVHYLQRFSVVNIGSKLRAYIAFTLVWGLNGVARLYLRETSTDMDETRNVSQGSRCTLTHEIREKSPQGLHLFLRV